MTHTETGEKSHDTDMSQKENLVEEDLTLGVVLPGGVEKTATIHRRKPVMDLLVVLCAKYHLNPSNHTIELISTSGNRIKLKPNALIETLEVKKILIKPKGMVDKNKKQSPPKPEATVRLLINYKTTHKTVLRVNPRVPVEELMPAICTKCELDQSSTVLLRNRSSEEPLDLAQSLNDFGLREVYAVDSEGHSSDKLPASPRLEEDKSLVSEEKVLKEKENKGLLSIFRRSKKKPDQGGSASAPASPAAAKDRPGSTTSLNGHAGLSIMPKKRRAPLPPMMASQSFPSTLSDHHTNKPNKGQEESGISRGSLTGSKRKAPPPPGLPCMSAPEETTQHKGIKVGALCNLEEIIEQEEMATAADPDTCFALVAEENGDGLNLSTDISMDSGKTEPTSPPADRETQDTSPNQAKGEEQSEQEPDSIKCCEETLKVEETCTSKLENGVSADCDSSPAEVGSQTTYLSGGNDKTSAGYRNEAVLSKVEYHNRERPPAFTEESPARQSQNGERSFTAPIKDAVPKRKTSSELSRQYLPRVGLTTYTIVPSKSSEKLKYFEVELTLQDPDVALKENETAGSPEPANCNPESGEPQVMVDEWPIAQGEELSNGTVPSENSDCGHMTPTLPAPAEASEGDDDDDGDPSPSYDGAFEAGPDEEIREKRTPPAIKPKPHSLLSLQQTRTFEEYVTTATTKSSACVVSHCSQEEGTGWAGKEEPMGVKEEKSFPPPSPPSTPPPPPSHTGQEAPAQQLGDELKSKGVSCPGAGNTRCTTNELEQPAELKPKKLASLVQPSPYKPSGPSAFCKAVFAATKRSQGLVPPTQLPVSKPMVSGTVRMTVNGEK